MPVYLFLACGLGGGLGRMVFGLYTRGKGKALGMKTGSYLTRSCFWLTLFFLGFEKLVLGQKEDRRLATRSQDDVWIVHCCQVLFTCHD